MRTFLVSAAAAITALAAAAPAAAQYYPAPQQGYGRQGYGYDGQQGLVRSYMMRADQLRQRIERSDGRDRINEREASRLRGAAIDLQNRTRAYAQNGLSGGERRDLDVRLARLEQALRYERRDGNGFGYNNQGYGRDQAYGRDRDRDGQWDRNDQFVDANRDGIDDRTGYRIPR